MLIRAELLSPDSKLFPPGQYLTIVSLHGTMMIMMMSSVVLGPFGNYFVPLMIGAKGMAFPRIEALTFWLLPMAGVILFSAVWVGGISTGWTGYPTLADQAQRGMDSYIVAFALIAISLILVGINMIATIVNMRAPGMTWQRLPIFVWSVLCHVDADGARRAGADQRALHDGARPHGEHVVLPALGGGTPFLYENIFWFFGHPEVYILALPGFGIVLEILPVFARKPLWGYRFAVAGMLGVCLLSFMVWQHHLFVSGINGDLRPFYMFTTELISVPTGFIFLVAMGTIWRAEIRYTVPMLFSLAFFFNFLIGGLSGRLPVGRAERREPARQLLRDGALPLHDHGRPRLRVLRRHVLLGAQDDRAPVQREAREDSLLGHVRGLQLDVPAALRRRHDGHAAPRRHLRAAPAVAQRLGVDLGLLPRRSSCSCSSPTWSGRR